MSEPKFAIHRIYAKELSCILKNSPHLFKQLDALKHEMELKIDYINLDEPNHYEVTLDIEVKTKNSDKSDKDEKEVLCYTAKIRQGGIFQLEGFEGKQRDQLLNIYCPEVLYPYARQQMSEMILMCSFPPMILMPINFQVLYQQKQEEEQRQKSATKH